MECINTITFENKIVCLTNMELKQAINNRKIPYINQDVDDSLEKWVNQRQTDLILIGKSVHPVIVHLIEKNPECFEGIILTYLVVKEVRKGFLFETVHQKNKDEIKTILNYAKSQNLYILKENENPDRFLITKEPINRNQKIDDDFLSNILDFYFKNHDYSNENVNRVSYDIVIEYKDLSASITSIGEAEKTDIDDLKNFLKNRVKRISKVLPSYFRVYYRINYVLSIPTLLNNFNYRFVVKNKYQYLNLFYNYWIEGKATKLFRESLQDEKLFEKNKKFLKDFLVYILEQKDFSEEKAIAYEEKNFK